MGREQRVYDAAGGEREHQHFRGSDCRHRRGRRPGCGGRVRHGDCHGRRVTDLVHNKKNAQKGAKGVKIDMTAPPWCWTSI